MKLFTTIYLTVILSVLSCTQAFAATYEAYYNTSGKVMVDIYGAKKPKTTTEKLDHVSYGYIFVGDSRLIAINNCTYFSEIGNNFIVAEAGQGYDWFMSKGREKIKNIVKNNPNYDKWGLIICLGVNDLNNVDNYVTAYSELTDNYDVYLVSVLPVDNEIFVKNTDISEFNKALSKIPNTSYVNIYSDMISDGFTTIDGLHYNDDTNVYIWQKLKRKLNLDWKT